MSVDCDTRSRHQVRLVNQSAEFRERWLHHDIHQAAKSVVAQVLSGGYLLPLAQFGGAQVFPIVEWQRAALVQRYEFRSDPVLHPSRVHELLGNRLDASFCPSVLSIVGFLGVAPLSKARKELAGLRSLGRTIAMIPQRSMARNMALAEFDLQGTAVVSCSDEVRVLVGGDPGIRQGSSMSPIWKRFYEEQLYDWALRTDSLPV
jgi:hypothetical protein